MMGCQSIHEERKFLIMIFQDIENHESDGDQYLLSYEPLYIEIRNYYNDIVYDEQFDIMVTKAITEFASYFRKKKNKLNRSPASDKFYYKIRNWDDKLCVRYGIVELRALYSFIFRGADVSSVLHKIFKNIDDQAFMYADRFVRGNWLSPYETSFNIRRLFTNAGFYSSLQNSSKSLDDFTSWADRYYSAIESSDYLFRCPGCYPNFQPIEFYMRRQSNKEVRYADIPSPEEFYPSISNKRVLLVSPFAEQLNYLYRSNKMHNLYLDIEIPDFDFYAIKAPITTYPNRNGEGWEESLNKLVASVNEILVKTKFDVFFASCGCYGLPLCHEISKTHNISSVYFGNYINTLFGISQKTSENFMAGRRNEENWIRSHLGSVTGMGRIDNGRYI
jgi:hypothetical protein